MSKHTPKPWKLSLGRYAEDAPIFGFAIRAEGKIPSIASAGIAEPNHALIVEPKDYPHDAGYCEICERHAEKHEDGSLAGPVVHTDSCPVGAALRSIAKAEGCS